MENSFTFHFYILFCGNNQIRLNMKTVKLITCNDAMEAHILQGR